MFVVLKTSEMKCENKEISLSVIFWQARGFGKFFFFFGGGEVQPSTPKYQNFFSKNIRNILGYKFFILRLGLKGESSSWISPYYVSFTKQGHKETQQFI